MDTSHLIEVRELNLRLYQDAIKIFQVGDKKIIIKHDDCPEDPLSWGHFEFFSTSKRYYTDKKHKTIRAKNGDLASISQFDGLEEIKKFLSANDYLYRYVCLYERSGFLYVSKEQIRRDYRVKKITKKIQEQVYEHMSSFASNEWEQYFNGDIYRYAIINSDDELEDSLCGIYGLDGIREVLKDEQGIEIPKI